MSNIEQDKKKGLYPRYNITKVNGDPIDPKAKYFVMRYDSDGNDKKHVEACQEAIMAYCKRISRHLPILSKELFIDVISEQTNLALKEMNK